METAAQYVMQRVLALQELAALTRPDLIVEVCLPIHVKPLCMMPGQGRHGMHLVGRVALADQTAMQAVNTIAGHTQGAASIVTSLQTALSCKQGLLALRAHVVPSQVDREQTSGGVNMVFVGTPITNSYQNLTNVILRIAPRAAAHVKAVLINAHFDTVFGTTGVLACNPWDAAILAGVTIYSGNPVVIYGHMPVVLDGGSCHHRIVGSA